MKKIKLKFNAKAISKFIKQYISVILWVILIAIFIAEGFVLRNSVWQFLGDSGELTNVGTAQVVRVDFNLYDNIEEQLKENEAYIPQSTQSADPFRVVEPPEPEQPPVIFNQF